MPTSVLVPQIYVRIGSFSRPRVFCLKPVGIKDAVQLTSPTISIFIYQALKFQSQNKNQT